MTGSTEFRFVPAVPGKYCHRCNRKAVDFLNVLAMVEVKTGHFNPEKTYCPACKMEMWAMPTAEQVDHV